MNKYNKLVKLDSQRSKDLLTVIMSKFVIEVIREVFKDLEVNFY